MRWNQLEIDLKIRPDLDQDFLPLLKVIKAHQASCRQNGRQELAISIRRAKDKLAVYKMDIHKDPAYLPVDCLLVERISKFLLWMKGGYAITVYGSPEIGRYLMDQYQPGGARDFDRHFMANVYETDFSLACQDYVNLPQESDQADQIMQAAKNPDAHDCRIGFDAGGSDRKVAAVMDGVVLYSEEVVWHPKIHADPAYHYDGIMQALRKAESFLPRVDSIGVSSAGVYINNHCRVASLFRQVPPELFETQVKDIYLRAAAELGAPVTVANDGDVAALAGAMDLGENAVMGMAMGTSEAVGFVNEEGLITGWLNELAFAPVDLAEKAVVDEWSGDRGCGVSYFSQDALIYLAGEAGIELDEGLSPAEKLLELQGLLATHPEQVEAIYSSIGVYLGHGLALYEHFYHMKHVQIMGRVMSGRGGEIIINKAAEVLAAEYPELASRLQIELPDEKNRRVGQSVAAASL